MVLFRRNETKQSNPVIAVVPRRKSDAELAERLRKMQIDLKARLDRIIEIVEFHEKNKTPD